MERIFDIPSVGMNRLFALGTVHFAHTHIHTHTRINLVVRWGDSQLYIPSMLLVRLYVVMTRLILFIRSIKSISLRLYYYPLFA